MANTLIPIQTITVGSGGASSIEFTNIPQNYTDLKFTISTQTATVTGDWDNIYVTFNGSTSGYLQKIVYGNGTNVQSDGGNTANIRTIYSNTASQAGYYFSTNEMYIPNYTSSTVKTALIDSAVERNGSAGHVNFSAAYWSGTSAITSVKFVPPSYSFVQNSSITLYGVSNGVKATGGTLTVAGGYAYHTFTSTGSFLPNQQIKGAEILAVAGGGGGGARFGGGGGAGGVLYSAGQTLNAGNTYTALVGAGGTAGYMITGKQGNDSVLSSVIAIGGGFGGGSDPTTSGGTGGSGGGGMGSTDSPNGGTAISGQGNAGGSGGSTTENDYRRSGGGGGGAGGVGTNVYNTGLRGDGGVGTTSYSAWHAITGTGVLSSNLYYIAGGGGGGIYGSSGSTSGGIGGGGAGSRAVTGGTATAGTANTGGGGGGAGGDAGTGAAGGSGLIIVRYPLS